MRRIEDSDPDEVDLHIECKLTDTVRRVAAAQKQVNRIESQAERATQLAKYLRIEPLGRYCAQALATLPTDPEERHAAMLEHLQNWVFLFDRLRTDH
jgi:hypothetical protein